MLLLSLLLGLLLSLLLSLLLGLLLGLLLLLSLLLLLLLLLLWLRWWWLWLLLRRRLRSWRRLSLMTAYRGWRTKRPLLRLRGLWRSLVPCLAVIARLRLGMLHSNRLLLCLHLLLLMSVLLSCLRHGSLLLRASRMLTTHLLLLLEQVGRKVDKRSLAHLTVPHCLQLLCLCLVQVHGILETHSHTALLVGKHGLLLLPVHECLLGCSLLLHHCRVHYHFCQSLPYNCTKR